MGSIDSFQRQQNNNEEKRDSKFKGVLDKFVGKISQKKKMNLY